MWCLCADDLGRGLGHTAARSTSSSRFPAIA
jgi:hypothetical protein